MVFYTKKQDAHDEETIQTLNYWTGVILLMAAGTLLYTTMLHILPEVYFDNGDHHHHHHHDLPMIDINGQRDEESGKVDQKYKEKEVKEERPCKSLQLATLVAGLFTA